MAIRVGKNVRFKIIPYEMVAMFDCLLALGKALNVEPVITGAAYEDYPEGKVHDQGYGLDVRTANLPEPKDFADQLKRLLRAVSPHYKVLYGDEQHLDHIHIGFSWFYAEERKRKKW